MVNGAGPFEINRDLQSDSFCATVRLQTPNTESKAMDKKIVSTPDFDPKLNSLGIPANQRPWWHVETEHTLFRAHELNDAMRLWRNGFDKSPVISVGKVW